VNLSVIDVGGSGNSGNGSGRGNGWGSGWRSGNGWGNGWGNSARAPLNNGVRARRTLRLPLVGTDLPGRPPQFTPDRGTETPMERWSIEVDKEYLKFSSAHFLIFPDGSAERLHGHNYRVYVEVEARLSRHGLVIDFIHIKPVIREMVDALDERWLLPGEHPELTVEEIEDDHVCVRYRERKYVAPRLDVLVLPMNNTSAENLAAYLGRQLMQKLSERFDELVVSRLRVSVEETSGQRGVYTFD
jgi:6-pyruvoyltetrahydropterin/6-carboxytetrahydropterin synthase